jgi:2-keto-4-pentenoate hydratase/2-oxohepta-3-ene-1,7-dioic acid hydratase in catechol pathway
MPVYYKGNHRSVFGPDEEIPWPAYTEELDYELEVACVLGGQGRDLDEDGARALIFGYTLMNDWSARDIQRKEMASRLGPAKGKDFATSLGPCIVTADELDPTALRLVARVDGEVWSEGDLGGARWTFPQMIAHVSQGEDVWPGDVYGSGTFGGGCGLDLGKFLWPGAVVELEADPIGVLGNRVGPKPARSG